MGRIHVGIVGLGYGARVLVPAFQRDERCQVDVLCDQDPIRAATAAAIARVPQWSADWRQVVANTKLDVLALAVPPTAQPEIAVAAFGAGKNVFCEKPVATSVVEAERILQSAVQAGRVHGVDFELAENDAFRRAKTLLDSGRLGALRHAAVSWHVETWAQRGGSSTWKLEAKHGGGTLNNFVSHVFHYIEWLLGPIAKLTARLLPESSRDDVTFVWLELKSGVPVSVTVSANAPASTGHRFEIYGDTGSLILENHGKDYSRGFGLVHRSREKTEDQFTANSDGPGNGRIEASARIVTRFLDAVLGGKACRPGLEEGVRVQRLIEAAQHADAKGRWVNM